MSNTQHYRQTGGLSPVLRGTTGRALSRLEWQHLIRAVSVRSEEQIQEEEIEAVCQIGAKHRRDDRARAGLEQQLTQLVPMSASRLQAIGDLTTLSVSEVVADAVRQVRRS